MITRTLTRRTTGLGGFITWVAARQRGSSPVMPNSVTVNISSRPSNPLADNDWLQPPDVIAQEIVDELKAALEQFRLIAGDPEIGETGRSG